MHADLKRNYKLKKILFHNMNNTYEFLSHVFLPPFIDARPIYCALVLRLSFSVLRTNICTHESTSPQPYMTLHTDVADALSPLDCSVLSGSQMWQTWVAVAEATGDLHSEVFGWHNGKIQLRYNMSPSKCLHRIHVLYVGCGVFIASFYVMRMSICLFYM